MIQLSFGLLKCVNSGAFTSLPCSFIITSCMNTINLTLHNFLIAGNVLKKQVIGLKDWNNALYHFIHCCTS